MPFSFLLVLRGVSRIVDERPEGQRLTASQEIVGIERYLARGLIFARRS
jgi:hypothetical protein